MSWSWQKEGRRGISDDERAVVYVCMILSRTTADKSVKPTAGKLSVPACWHAYEPLHLQAD